MLTAPPTSHRPTIRPPEHPPPFATPRKPIRPLRTKQQELPPFYLTHRQNVPDIFRNDVHRNKVNLRFAVSRQLSAHAAPHRQVIRTILHVGDALHLHSPQLLPALHD